MTAPSVLCSVIALHASEYRSQLDLSSFKLALVGGSPTSAEVHARLQQYLGCPVLQVYGTTESGHMIGPKPGEAAAPPFGSLGRVAPWVKLRVSGRVGE